MKKTSVKKKAIEPLIATILLVVVSVIIVTIILNWGKIFSSEALSQTQTISLKKSDAEHYIFGDSLRNGTVTFRYSPPSGSSFDDYEITSYKVLSDLGESKITSLATSHALRQGTNAINLKGFLSLEIEGQRIPENSKVTILLITEKNQFLTISNLTNTVTEVFVDLPWVMYNGRKLYIQPSGSSYDGEGDFSETEDIKFAWCGDWNGDNYFCNPGSNFPAKEYCENLDAHGYDDWYLPTATQLRAIWDSYVYTTGDDCLSDEDDGFPWDYVITDCVNEQIQSTYNNFVPLHNNYYWSSTEYSGSNAYRIFMYSGYMYGYSKGNENYVRCVRDP